MRCPLRRPSLARPAAALARGWLPPPPARAPDENFRVLLSPNKSEITKAASARDSGQSCQPGMRARALRRLVLWSSFAPNLSSDVDRRPSRIRSWRAPQGRRPRARLLRHITHGRDRHAEGLRGQEAHSVVLPESRHRRMNRGRKSLRGPAFRVHLAQRRHLGLLGGPGARECEIRR